ncbi:MAG: hypothetical protein ACT4R6_02595 [Gemmatimonadaceae bacterium]
MLRSRVAWLAAFAVLPLGLVRSQAADSSIAQCYGFAFGAWRPALDLVAAGHEAARLPSDAAKAPGGRDWASDAVPNDTTLLLFPAWWPAGVQVTFARRPSPSPRPLAAADTVSGYATAFVADARAETPRATVRLWLVPCK